MNEAQNNPVEDMIDNTVDNSELFMLNVAQDDAGEFKINVLASFDKTGPFMNILDEVVKDFKNAITSQPTKCVT